MPSSIGGVGGPGGVYVDVNQPDESHVVVPGEVATISLDAGDHRSQRWKVLNKPEGMQIREHMERDPNMPSGVKTVYSMVADESLAGRASLVELGLMRRGEEQPVSRYSAEFFVYALLFIHSRYCCC